MTNDSVNAREVPENLFTRVFLAKDPGDGGAPNGKWMGIFTYTFVFEFAGRKNPTL